MPICKLCFIVSPVEPYQPATTRCPEQTSQLSLQTTPVISVEQDDDMLTSQEDNLLTTVDSQSVIGDLMSQATLSKYKKQ